MEEFNTSEDFTSSPMSVMSNAESKLGQMSVDGGKSSEKKAIKGQKYSTEEDLAILRYIAKKDYYSLIRRIKIWREMENRNVCPGRTHVYMKEHFINKFSGRRGTLIRDLKKHLTEVQYNRFQLEKEIYDLEDKKNLIDWQLYSTNWDEFTEPGLAESKRLEKLEKEETVRVYLHELSALKVRKK